MENKNIIYSSNWFKHDNFESISIYDEKVYYSISNKIIQKDTNENIFENQIIFFSFNFDGTTCYILFERNFVSKFNLSIPWDITTSIQYNESFYIPFCKSIEYTETSDKQILILTTNSCIYFYNVNDWNNKILITIVNNPITNHYSLTVNRDCTVLYILDVTINTVFIYKITENFLLNYKKFFFMGSDYDSNLIFCDKNDKLFFLTKEKYVFEYLIQNEIKELGAHVNIKKINGLYDVFIDSSKKDTFTGLPTTQISSLIVWDNNDSIPSYSMNIKLINIDTIVFSFIASFDNIIILLREDLTISLQDNNTVLTVSEDKFINYKINEISFVRSEDLLNYQVILNDKEIINYTFESNNQNLICSYSYLRDTTNFIVEEITLL